MNTKRIIFSILSLIVLSGTAYSQTTMDSLKRYIWEYIEEGELKIANSYNDFSETTLTETDEWLEENGSLDRMMGTDVNTYPYYLMPLERFYGFDESKVGRVHNGQVIVVKRNNDRGSSNYWIQSLTDRELVITSITKGGPLITTRWKAVPRPASIPTGIDYRITNELPDGLSDIKVELSGTVSGQRLQFISSSPPNMPRPGQSATYSGNTFSLPAGTVIGDLQLRLYVNGNSGGTTRIVVRNGAHAAENIGDIGGGNSLYLSLGSFTVPSSGRHSIDITVSVD